MSLSLINFKNFITLQRGFDLPKHKRNKGKYPIVASTSITDYHDEYKVDGEGVITGRSGALGKVQYINGKYWPLNTTLWVKDFKNNIPKYVYYYLKTLDLKRFNSGAGVPTLNRNDLDTLQIKIYKDKQTQKKIAGVLSAYDDLIENNNKRIKILEDMAQKLYKHWFVDFKFPDHENTKFIDSELGKIPEGWKVITLNQLVDNVRESTKSGEHLINRGYVPIDCIAKKSFSLAKKQSYKNAQSSLILFNQGDFLFGNMRAYFHKVSIASFYGITRTTCFVLRNINIKYYAFAFLTLFRKETIDFASQHSKGATIPYAVWDNGLDNMKVILPPEKMADTFNQIIVPILDNTNLLTKKNIILGQTLDLLLPRLISGEIAVSELEVKI